MSLINKGRDDGVHPGVHARLEPRRGGHELHIPRAACRSRSRAANAPPELPRRARSRGFVARVDRSSAASSPPFWPGLWHRRRSLLLLSGVCSSASSPSTCGNCGARRQVRARSERVSCTCRPARSSPLAWPTCSRRTCRRPAAPKAYTAKGSNAALEGLARRIQPRISSATFEEGSGGPSYLGGSSSDLYAAPQLLNRPRRPRTVPSTPKESCIDALSPSPSFPRSRSTPRSFSPCRKMAQTLALTPACCVIPT